MKTFFETRKKMFRTIFRNPPAIFSMIFSVIFFLFISLIVWLVSLLLAILIFTGMRLVMDPAPPPPVVLINHPNTTAHPSGKGPGPDATGEACSSDPFPEGQSQETISRHSLTLSPPGLGAGGLTPPGWGARGPTPPRIGGWGADSPPGLRAGGSTPPRIGGPGGADNLEQTRAATVS
jgi:hypothetical protein